MTKKPMWDVFLSHSSDDLELALKLQADVERQAIDGRKVVVWLDDSDIPFGGNIPKYIEEGLTNSQRFAVLMSKAYFESRSGWTDAEWHAAIFPDPDNRSGRLLTLLASECNVPALLRPLKRIDLRGSHYQQGVADIVKALSQQPDRNRLAPAGASPIIDSASGDAVEEVLYSNLFQFIKMPQRYYVSQLSPIAYPRRGAAALTPQQLSSRIWTATHTTSGLFQIYGDRLRTFADPRTQDSPLRQYIQPDTTLDFDLHSSDLAPAIRTQIVGLLSASIQGHLTSYGIRHDDEHPNRFFYPSGAQNSEHEITWTPSKRTAVRKVAREYHHTRTGELMFWLHAAAYIRCVQLASTFALEVEPTYVLTLDGRSIMRGSRVGKLVSRWTQKERNFQIFYNVMFWRFTLRSAGENIKTGSRDLVLADLPLAFATREGIAGDHRDFRRDLDSERGDDIEESPLSTLPTGQDADDI